MKIRRIITLTVFLSFIFLALSGIMLFLSPQGRVAYWAGWSLIGLSKEEWSAVHITLMVLFLATSIWHIVLNWRPIVGYLKNRSKKLRILTPESSVALLLTMAFFVGPLLRIQPFGLFLDAGEDIKGYWESTRGSPPWGHAEESRLDAFCRRVVDFQRWEGEGAVIVDCDEAQAALVNGGIVVDGPTQTVLEIARANGTTPQLIAEIVVSVARPATPDEVAAGLAGNPGRRSGDGRRDVEGETAVEAGGESEVRFAHPTSGLGRITLREYSTDLGYDLEKILAILAGQGLEVDPDARLREVATALGLEPSGVIDALNKGG